MTQALATTECRRSQSLVTKMASKFSIDPDKLLSTLKATAFKQSDGTEPTNEQMAALLVVADQYGLNPFTREIFAFADKRAGIVPVVGVDGWSRIINDHPQSDGFEFRESEEIVTPEGGKPCPKWMEVVIYRKDRSHPIVVREYIDEVYRKANYQGPWQTHTKRFFRHKVLIQGARIAYGFGGIYDDDEAQRIVDMGQAEVVQRPQQVQQPRPKAVTQTAPTVDAPVEIVDGPLGEDLINLIKAKLEAASISEHELIKALKVDALTDLKVSQFAAVIAWIKNPS
jgi:phage recombination protein Bet